MVISAEVRNYGVDMYVGCNIENCHMYLYKHAASSTDLAVLPLLQGVESDGPSVVYNIRGRVVARLEPGTTWNRTCAPAGVYLMVGEKLRQKVVVVR